MKKRLLVSLMTIVFSSASLAANEPFNGFYADVGVGWENLQVTDEIFLHGTLAEAFDITMPYSPMLTDNSVSGGVGIGYSKVIKQMFLGGLEARANFENLETTVDNKFTAEPFALVLNSKTKAKLNNDFALLFKLGLVMQPNTLIYGLVGPSWGNFKVSSRSHFSFGSEVTSINTSESNYETGWLAGLGIEQLVTSNLSLAFEYIHADYGTFDSTKVSKPFVVSGFDIGSLTMSNEINAKTDNVSLRLTYYFDKVVAKKLMKN